MNSHNPLWVNLGAGPSIIGSDFGLTAGMVFSYQTDDEYVISSRMIGMTNINPTVQRIDPTNMKYKMTDYVILYGKIFQSAKFLFSAGAGIGIVRADYQTINGISTNTSISLPLEGQLFWRPTNYFGIGFYTHACYN